MNHSQVISELCNRTGWDEQESSAQLSLLLQKMYGQWMEGNSIHIQNFGSFEINKEMEYIAINPLTRQRMLFPPKLQLVFRAENTQGGDMDGILETKVSDRETEDKGIPDILFSIVHQALIADRYVKIKGLGTFKLRAEQTSAGNTEIAFIPDHSLQELVNRPFSHFESVVVNDDSITKDILIDED